MSRKVYSLSEAVASIKEGESLTFSGFGHSLQPLAFCRELIRQRKRGLNLITMGECWVADFLCGAGCVETVRLSCLLFEGYGRCQNFSRAVEEGRIIVEDYSHFGIASRFLAGALGLPFMPVRSMLGSDILSVRTVDSPKGAVIESPFGKEKVVLMPAVHPDVAVIHASRADPDGNVQLLGPRSVLDEQVRSARRVIVTVEEIVDPTVIQMQPELTIIPGFLVDMLVEAPFGAHPAGMYRYYDYDAPHIERYYTASRSPEEFERYLDEFVYSLPDHFAYLERIGIERLFSLRSDPYWGYRPPL